MSFQQTRQLSELQSFLALFDIVFHRYNASNDHFEINSIKLFPNPLEKNDKFLNISFGSNNLKLINIFDLIYIMYIIHNLYYVHNTCVYNTYTCRGIYVTTV